MGSFCWKMFSLAKIRKSAVENAFLNKMEIAGKVSAQFLLSGKRGTSFNGDGYNDEHCLGSKIRAWRQS